MLSLQLFPVGLFEVVVQEIFNNLRKNYNENQLNYKEMLQLSRI